MQLYIADAASCPFQHITLLPQLSALTFYCLLPSASAAAWCTLPFLQAARDLSDAGEEGDGMMMNEVSPSSPSIQEKEIKAASQPSNTNGNTSGSNESDASKRWGTF